MGVPLGPVSLSSKKIQVYKHGTVYICGIKRWAHGWFTENVFRIVCVSGLESSSFSCRIIVNGSSNLSHKTNSTSCDYFLSSCHAL